ncbi:hypothetical protein EMPS_00807 [Entomortierella parvispora]|uniref:Adhesin domain-containing protein n=1 Tax=Entomortierella parvispora TaxID=205924 RepID=A0A9P3H1L8_9FUNG|nr:hypothetical protein EMPS_00807 [Entomortierella parvispora]
MSAYLGDRKTVLPPSQDVLEDERATFGDQAPFASASPSQPSPLDASSSVTNGLQSPRDIVPSQPTTPSAPSQSTLGRNPQEADPTPDVAPPSYEEVARSSPHDPYRTSPRGGGQNNPSTPLMSGDHPRPSTYSSIPVPPPAVPYTPSLNGSIRSNSERASRFNKFWIVFFLVVVLLAFTDDESREGDDGSGGGGSHGKTCEERATYVRNMTALNVADTLTDFSIFASGLPVKVVFEQSLDDSPDAPNTIFSHVEARAMNREDVMTLRSSFLMDPDTSIVKVTINRLGSAKCVQVLVKFILPRSVKSISNIKISLTEGSTLINLLEKDRPPVQVGVMDIRVINGESNVRALVAKDAKVGGSVGKIQGELVVGKEFSVIMVDGNVTMNLSPAQGRIEGKVTVSNGNIQVGLPPTYEGVFKLETRNGALDVINRDPQRTVVTVQEPRLVRGYNSALGKEPRGATSEVRLEMRNGNASLSMKHIEL